MIINFLKEVFNKENIIKALSNPTPYSPPFFTYYESDDKK